MQTFIFGEVLLQSHPNHITVNLIKKSSLLDSTGLLLIKNDLLVSGERLFSVLLQTTNRF